MTGDWHWEFSFWGVAGGIALGLGALLLLPREWSRSGKDRVRRALALTRFAATLLVGITLLKPEKTIRIPLKEKPSIHVLWDDSASMGTRDHLDPQHPESPPITREQWVRSQLEPPLWEALRNRFELRFFPLSQIPESPGPAEGTDLHAALRTQLRAAVPPRAVVLLGDGDWNTGKNPLSAASELGARGIPVFTVQAGADTPLPDVEVHSLQLPSYSMVGERVAASFRLINRLNREVRTRVILTSAETQWAEREVVIPAQGELSETLTFAPQQEGELHLRLEVPVQAGEVNPDNNVQQARLSVRRETLKVLLIDSLPRWEIRYLRNALSRDPGIELRTVMLHPQLGAARGEGYLAEIPSRMEQLQAYDVVFVGDVGTPSVPSPGSPRKTAGLTEENTRQLRTLVEEQASGLVFLPGPEGLQNSLKDSALGDLFPVETQPGTSMPGPPNSVLGDSSGRADEDGRLELTLRGRSHWLTLLTADPASNESVWRALPGFRWYAPVTRARSGSEVLAVHDSARNSHGRIPLLVTRNAGLGKVLYMGTDSAWRWRRGVEDTYHYRFWGQVVRWMAHQRHLSHGEGVRLFYTPASPKQGDAVHVHATLLDQLGIPVGDAQAQLTVTAPGGSRETLPMTPGTSAWGAVSSRFQPRETGTYRLSLESPSTGRSLATTIEVQNASAEKIGGPARGAVLREIALLSGGSWTHAGESQSVLETLGQLPLHPPAETRFRLWCHPLWEAIILGLWLALWAGRKFRGLA